MKQCIYIYKFLKNVHQQEEDIKFVKSILCNELDIFDRNKNDVVTSNAFLNHDDHLRATGIFINIHIQYLHAQLTEAITKKNSK